MDIQKAIKLIRDTAKMGVDTYERRPGKYQLVIPILHEDGDMVDIYLQDSPMGENYIRVCDFGMTLMRLSYSFEINANTRQRILNSILTNNGVTNDNGNLYLDTPLEMLYESILQFSGCVQKVCNMRYWSRDIIHSSFYEDLGNYITTQLIDFDPRPDIFPIPDHKIITVDWSLSYKTRKFYLFGVRGNSKAKSTAIALLECKKSDPRFISLIVHEDMQDLGGKEVTHLARNADKQYPTPEDFKEDARSDIERYAA